MERQPQRNIKTLVIDDVKSARITLRSYLNRLGFHDLLEAADGEEALSVLNHHPDVALIICDWQMPGLPGIELARQLHDLTGSHQTPFIMVTSKDAWQDLAEAAVSGVHGYLIKPVTIEELDAEVQRVLSGQPLPR